MRQFHPFKDRMVRKDYETLERAYDGQLDLPEERKPRKPQTFRQTVGIIKAMESQDTGKADRRLRKF